MQKRYVTLRRASCPPIDHPLQVIKLDPLSPWGYERKHAALHKKADIKAQLVHTRRCSLQCRSRLIQRFAVRLST